MTHGADLTSKLSPPSASDQLYRGDCANTRSHAFAVARTWFDARTELMRLLGCGPGEIVVEVNRGPAPPWFAPKDASRAT